MEESPHVKIETFPDGRQKLTIEGAETDDIGQYRCVATNEAGEAKTAADVEGERRIHFCSASQGQAQEKYVVSLFCSCEERRETGIQQGFEKPNHQDL